MLDAYLSGGSDISGAQQNPRSQSDVFAAVRALGIVDTVDALSLRCGAESLYDDSAFNPRDTVPSGRAQTVEERQALADRRALRDACERQRRLSARDSAARKCRQDSGFTIFGLSTFRENTSLFDPNLNGPVDAGYRLGPGDQLALILTGDVNAAYTLDVTREGFIVVPEAGQIYVANLTLGELENILYSRLGRVYSGVRRGPGATTRLQHQSCTPSHESGLRARRRA